MLQDETEIKDDFNGTTETGFLTTNTSPVAMSLSTTNQASLCPPILALWPSVRVNQPAWTDAHRKKWRKVQEKDMICSMSLEPKLKYKQLYHTKGFLRFFLGLTCNILGVITFSLCDCIKVTH